jgi:nickel transport system permease protein
MKTMFILKKMYHKKSTVIFTCVLAVVVASVLAAPIIAPNDIFTTDLLNRFSAPSAEYPFGTDELGRCIFSRILFGGRASLLYALITTSISAVAGTAIGMFAGYKGGKTDGAIMRICDVMYSFPSLVITLVIVAILGRGIYNILAAMLVTQWLYYARMSRGMTMNIRNQDYVAAARSCGSSTLKIIRKHILPNIVPQLIAILTIDFGHTILTISGLSFLGLGVQPPSPEWGALVNDARAFIFTDITMLLWPGLMILLVVLSVNVIGDSLRDALDMKMD